MRKRGNGGVRNELTFHISLPFKPAGRATPAAEVRTFPESQCGVAGEPRSLNGEREWILE